jgi:hypothetical protein
MEDAAEASATTILMRFRKVCFSAAMSKVTNILIDVNS